MEDACRDDLVGAGGHAVNVEIDTPPVPTVSVACVEAQTDDHEFDATAVFAALAKLPLKVIFLPGKGRMRMEPYTQSSRESTSHGCARRMKASTSVVARAEKPVCWQAPIRRRAKVHRYGLQAPLMTPELEAAVSAAQTHRAERIRDVQATAAGLPSAC